LPFCSCDAHENSIYCSTTVFIKHNNVLGR
jgi:hypothetical protein